jgi:hypothetical protein
MRVWEQRPVEVANLLNPAFCAILIRQTIQGYSVDFPQGMPYSLSFLILPLVLHENTRSSLPKIYNPKSKIHSWIHIHPEIKAELPDRVKSLKPYSQEAIIFGLQRKVFRVGDHGLLIITQKKLEKPKWDTGSEPQTCYKKSLQIGRLFANTGDEGIIFTLLGIRP